MNQWVSRTPIKPASVCRGGYIGTRISCEAEKEQVFATSWQVICHLNDIPKSGDYHTLDFLGEPLVAVRGRMAVSRHFSTFAVIARPGWSTAARGIVPGASYAPTMPGLMISTARLAAVPHRKEFADFSLAQYGLKPLETEIYKGFVFVRLKPGLPSVAEMLAPYQEELA